ncbi:MAG: ABC transporter ATP-binding protein [Acidobacteria bacterium]|nr:ABC transporter ATP-binding protein [Acidobacteriota bacterium]
MNTGAALAFQGIAKTYPKFELQATSFEVPVGSIVGLVGQNGAGKSTLIKCGLGLVKPDQGRVIVAGEDCTGQNGEKLRTLAGYVPETECFYEWMTIEEKFAFVRSYYPTWDRQYESELVKRYHLDTKKKLKHLSKGMRAKVSLILALAFRPRVLILDEPTSGLDPVMKSEFLDELCHLVERKDVDGILISSHILSEIARIANRIVVLQSGKILADQGCKELLEGWRKAYFQTNADAPEWNGLAGRIRSSSESGRRFLLIREDELHLLRELEMKGARSIELAEPSLEEVLLEAVTVREETKCGH